LFVVNIRNIQQITLTSHFKDSLAGIKLFFMEFLIFCNYGGHLFICEVCSSTANTFVY